jgi:hypothetical protein
MNNEKGVLYFDLAKLRKRLVVLAPKLKYSSAIMMEAVPSHHSKLNTATFSISQRR